ncbi:MAG: hypothetical protein JWO58_686 [Chitinophagaceae bacterium]|nr:hypothetical protein [Chitinophagaceae bacterium]
MSAVDFRSLFEATPGLYVVLSPEFTIVAASDAYLKLAMKKREELIGLNFFDVFPDSPADQISNGMPLIRAAMNKVLAEKTTQSVPMRKYDTRRPDGTLEEKYWSSEDKPILNSKNEIEYIIHSVQDISELTKSEKLFSTIFEHNPFGIALSRISDGRIMSVNQAHLNLFGFSSKEEVIGKTSAELNMLINPEDRSNIVSRIQKGEHISGLEGQIRTVKGDLHWISCSFELVDINGEKYLLASMQDINNKREQQNLLEQQAEQLKQANEELETFSYSVSHDLKAPLRSLEGFSKLLIENYKGKFDEDADRWLQFIAGNANRMGVLINDILNFSRISRSSVNKSHVHMQPIVEKLFDLEKNNYPNKVIELHLSDLPDVYGDPTMLGQVWQNLISNALKYSSKNELIIVTINGRTDQQTVQYSIQDNGVGFDEKYKDKLFGVFQRLHRTEEFEGTGVGLAIVNRIIQKHSGSIQVNSELGKGTTFAFSLPLQKNN